MSNGGSNRLLGFDGHGEVFDHGEVIFRRIKPEQKESVARIHQTFLDAKLDQKGIVETVLRADGDLEHRKLVISYPHEWPANMYKDAVLFHLRLFSELEKAHLTLKDALPNNILFDCTTPSFIDFLSVVPPEQLDEEEWLDSGGYEDRRFAVVDRMLLPYMVLPLLFLARDEQKIARELLSIRACNTSGTPPSWRELINLPARRSGYALRGYVRGLLLVARLRILKRRLPRLQGRVFLETIDELSRLVAGVDVTPPLSGYSSYYDEKREQLSLADPVVFLPKQKAVYELLHAERPARVLDIGANTGWYSSLAASLGSSVIALEQDESCVDILYRKAKGRQLRILPLRVGFSDLKTEIYSSRDLAREYPDRQIGTIPLYRAGLERFQADLVLVLGLVHHLVLGEGRTLEEVFEIFGKLARKVLVLEFVCLDDEKIVNEPTFFANLDRSDATTYNLDRAREIGRRHFSSVEIRDSHPETRKILIFRK